MTVKLRPRIYVASLSDYNAGCLYGAWIDPTRPLDEVTTAVARMLADAPTAGAEEFAIHDYDEFGPLRLDEYESLERIVTIAQGIDLHGEAYAAWANFLGSASWEDLDRFDDVYIGSYDSLSDYADDLLFNLDINPDPSQWAPDLIAPYVHFDLTAFSNGLRQLETICHGQDGVVHIFNP